MMQNKENEDSEFLHDFHLTEDDLSNEAQRLFPFHTEILESLNSCGHSVLTNNLLSSGGKHIICSKLVRSHNNVKNVLNYLATKPLETKEKISDVPMIVICGLPRTGTTLLHNLMGCDPSCRTPLVTDMTMQPIPPILRSNIDEHKRRAKSEADIEAKVFETAKCDIKKFQKNLSSSHALFPAEEDAFLLGEVGIQPIYAILAPKETNLHTWYFNQHNKDFAYKYHQTVLQMLHDVDPPRTHWQLKSSVHTYYIDTLLKYYPQTSIIMSHRRLDEVLPSLYRFWLSAFSHYFNEDELINLKIILDQTVPTSIDIRIDRIIEFHNRKPSPKNVFDIQYEDLMKDPIGTVHRIYDHFDFLKWSDECEEAMRKWLIDNPQGQQGRHSYSLAEFNLETQMDKQLYKEYENIFLST
ncbi:unnamed protein product [Rotaria sp. Silwood1]|nr:unnamed protein product [Rotaria sp. Silwood1]CAF4995141.1 unnamed protein product [Rotaria sp. Silwood1]